MWTTWTEMLYAVSVKRLGGGGTVYIGTRPQDLSDAELLGCKHSPNADLNFLVEHVVFSSDQRYYYVEQLLCFNTCVFAQ